MELVEDSTTSSASNSTRRQSAMTAAHSPMPQVATPVDQTERPVTPVESQNNEVVQGTPESQRDLHQRKRRGTSELSSTSEDESFSSPGDAADSSPIRVEDSIDSESDTDGDTAMSLDEATQNSVRSSGSSSTQTSLDERLRAATSLAGTKGIQYDENGSDDDDDQSMEIADNTVTHALRQYARNGKVTTASEAQNDQENITHPQDHEISVDQEDDEMEEDATTSTTMDMTRAVGGIIPRNGARTGQDTMTRRRSNVSRRRSSGVNTSYNDETMDLTVAKGGILSDKRHDEDEDPSDNEEMTMEMTNVVGGLKQPNKKETTPSFVSEETESMDMTMAAGGILPPIEEQTEPQSFVEGGMTTAMDVTRALGGILQDQSASVEYPDVSDLPQVEDKSQPTPSTQLSQELDQDTTASIAGTGQLAPGALESGSPTLKPRLSARKNALGSRSTTPKSAPSTLSLQPAGQSTPSKQLTPAPAKSTSAKRTPILSANVMARGASPKKLFTKELQQRASPAVKKSPHRNDMLFAKDETTGMHTPRVVLHAPKPHQHLRRRSSGVGVDNGGTGSPRVSEILSRRTSIGDVVAEFQLPQGQKRQISFDDPRQLEHEVDAERAEEHRRESGRFIMEQEANEQQDENTTTNLRDMIESMSPKKETRAAKLKGRKSLAVGSAKGLLGKRPAELDDEEDEEVTPKRLKTVSREASPVKKVHLPKPPTKEETTGRLSRSEQLQLAAVSQMNTTPTVAPSPSKKAQSPEKTGRFREPVSAKKPTSFEEKLDNVVGATDISTTHPEAADSMSEEEKISLQQFLNLTNIHFIELSTTKRRHTMAQPLAESETVALDNGSQSILVAAATTLPLLELYQHATKELKTYISSGRKIIRQIEAETLADQPALFRDYVDARPDVKAVMDNQFRNGKTNARLQSKEGWYTWRGQLVDGLQTGLEGIRADLEQDKETLSQQQQNLDRMVPHYAARKHQLGQQAQDLRRRVQEHESIDQEALRSKREELARLDEEIAQGAQRASQLQQELSERVEMLSQANELRQEMDDQIGEAVRVQEEQNRWHSKDVRCHKVAVEKLEQETGWKLLTAEEETEEPNDFGAALTLRYKGQLQLFFYPSAFQSKSDAGRRRSGRKSRSVSGPTAPISLTYSPDEYDEKLPKELSTELRFFLQLLRSQLHAFTMMPKGSITCQTLLKTLSEGWTTAQKVAEEMRRLNSVGMVRVSIQGDEKLGAKLMLMQEGRSRVDIEFVLTVLPLNDGEISTSTTVIARPIYGSAASIMDSSKTRKVQHALTKEIENNTLGEGAWASAVRGFEEWLQAQTQVKVESSKPKMTAEAQPKAQEVPALTTKNEQRRATTQSPQRSTTPKMPARSPLAPKTTNSRVQKKALPVPKKPFSSSQSQSQSHSQLESFIPVASQQKENVIPTVAKFVNGSAPVVNENLELDDVFAGTKPAIPPEIQEAMMYTPVKKRMGALRRSPI